MRGIASESDSEEKSGDSDGEETNEDVDDSRETRTAELPFVSVSFVRLLIRGRATVFELDLDAELGAGISTEKVLRLEVVGEGMAVAVELTASGAAADEEGLLRRIACQGGVGDLLDWSESEEEAWRVSFPSASSSSPSPSPSSISSSSLFSVGSDSATSNSSGLISPPFLPPSTLELVAEDFDRERVGADKGATWEGVLELRRVDRGLLLVMIGGLPRVSLEAVDEDDSDPTDIERFAIWEIGGIEVNLVTCQD